MQETGFLQDDLLPLNTQRLNPQRAYPIHDALPAQPYDDVVQLATLICAAPMATLTLVDASQYLHRVAALPRWSC